MEGNEHLNILPSTHFRQVEFRPAELQLTDFANAAFCVFIFILSRLITERRLELTIPISMVIVSSHFTTNSSFQVLENFDRAQKRDAVHSQRFHYRLDTGSLHLACGSLCFFSDSRALSTLFLMRSLHATGVR